ncbi:hypothetical protein KR018_002261, partial [Drosophila ironensis]
WLDLHRKLIQNLREYADKLSEKIGIINSSVIEYQEEIEEAEEDPELYLSNPLNSFRLIRHLHQDWIAWQVYMEQKVGEEQVAKIESLLQDLPQDWEYKKAAEDVLTVARFYNYEPAELVAQNEKNSSIHLSPLDCYHLGHDRLHDGDFVGAAKWLGAAANNFSLSEYSDLYEHIGAPRWQMYRDYARVLRVLNRKEMYEAYDKANSLSPQNVHLMQEIGEMELLSLRDPLDPVPDDFDLVSEVEEMCRGIVSTNTDILTCEYNNEASAFLKLAPLPVEQILEVPFTVMYPRGVYDSEIEHIVNVFERCPPNALFELDQGITGCSVSDGYSFVTKRIAERVLDMTGLNSGSESFYILEYDTLQPLEVYQLFRASKRFASAIKFPQVDSTVMIFLKDVPVGGAIVLPDYDFNMFVQPEKGNVLIAFGEEDYKTTICPNVAGQGLGKLSFSIKIAC